MTHHHTDKATAARRVGRLVPMVAALLLLATLNRLEGMDDVRLRAELLKQLSALASPPVQSPITSAPSSSRPVRARRTRPAAAGTSR